VTSGTEIAVIEQATAVVPAPLDTTFDAVLSSEEEVRLTKLESVIERGIRSFWEVGDALAAIRAGKLYRATHQTFEAYCKDRWRIGRSYANKQIAAAEVVAALGTTVPILPTAESQIRPLMQFNAKDRPLVWQTITKKIKDWGEELTEARIRTCITCEIATARDGPFKERRLALRRARREQYAEQCRVAAEPYEPGDGEGSGEKCSESPPRLPEQLLEAVGRLTSNLNSAILNFGFDLERRKKERGPFSCVVPDDHPLAKDVAGVYAAVRGLTRWLRDNFPTCPDCGCHEPDEDGNCANCHNPNIVGAEGTADA